MAEKKLSLSSELHHLEELQNSIKTMETRIQYLVKEEFKNQKNVQKVLKSSIAKIGHKASQAKFHEEMRVLHQKQNMNRSALHGSIEDFKEKHKQEISIIKGNILEMKRAESSVLKEISRKNQQIIRQNRRKQAETKKNTIEQIRFLRNQTKKELQRKKEDEEKEQQRKKEEMIAERLKQKTILQLKISELESLQSKLVSKIEESLQTVRTLNEITNESIKIPKEEFYKIIKDVKKEKGKHVPDEVINQAVFDRFMRTKTEMPYGEQTKRDTDTTVSGGKTK